MKQAVGTREKIIQFAKEEFLKRGFKDASLRSIASASGMTTGAIYTHFKDKNHLFESIVDPVCDYIESIISDMGKSYYSNKEVVDNISKEKSLIHSKKMYDYIYENLDVFKILITGAEGSSRQGFIHRVVSYELEQTIAYLSLLEEKGEIDFRINRSAIHAISESYINSLLEPVRHDMSYEEAIENLEFLVTFHTGGWLSILNSMKK